MFVADVQQMALIRDAYTSKIPITYDISDADGLKLVWGKQNDRSHLAKRCEFNLKALSLNKLNVP